MGALPRRIVGEKKSLEGPGFFSFQIRPPEACGAEGVANSDGYAMALIAA